MSIYKIKESKNNESKEKYSSLLCKISRKFRLFCFRFYIFTALSLSLITREVISTSKSIDDSGADVDVVGLAAVDVVGLEAVDAVGLAAVGVVCLVTVDVDVVVLVIFSDSRAVVTIDVVSGFFNFFGILNSFKY